MSSSGKITASVTLGGRLLPSTNVETFEIVTSIEDVLPKGVLTLNDQNGTILQEFQGLEIGAQVCVTTVGISEDHRDIQFGPLANLTFGVNPNYLTMVGKPEVLIGHKWELQKDQSTHIFKGKPNSDIIKTILNDETRGFTIPYQDKQFQTSDEKGDIPRFKCGIDDYNFITKRLLPYTTIKNQPALFWIDEYGYARLDSFDNLMLESPKALLVPQNQNLMGEEKEKVSSLLDSCEGNLVPYSGIEIKVGDENISTIIKSLKTRALIDGNTLLGTIFEGSIKPSLKVGSDSGSLVASKLPMFAWDFNDAQTDFKIFTNRNAEDSSAFAINSTRQFVNMFRVNLTTFYCGDTLKTGDTVYLYVENSKREDDGVNRKTYWLCDKWLVFKTRHYWSKENRNMYSNLLLVRPSFYVAKQYTNMPNLDYYYGV